MLLPLFLGLPLGVEALTGHRQDGSAVPVALRLHFVDRATEGEPDAVPVAHVDFDGCAVARERENPATVVELNRALVRTEPGLVRDRQVHEVRHDVGTDVLPIDLDHADGLAGHEAPPKNLRFAQTIILGKISYTSGLN